MGEKKKAEQEAFKAKVNEREMEKKVEEVGVNVKAEQEKKKIEVGAAAKVEADVRELEKEFEEAAINAKADEAADEPDRRAKLKLEQEELVRLELETCKMERIEQEHEAERHELELIERHRREKEKSELERIELERSLAIAKAEKVAAAAFEEKRIGEEKKARILAFENEKEQQQIEVKAEETWSKEEEAILKTQAEVKRKMQSSDDERLEKVRTQEEEKPRLQPPNRVSKWMARLNFKTDKNNSDLSSNAATVGENNSNAFPKVLFDDGGEVDSRKEPEIGSI